VVATGFDASYFAQRQALADDEAVSEEEPAKPVVMSDEPKTDEKVMSGIDMTLDDNDDEHGFKSDAPMPNIWSITDDDDADDDKDEKDDDSTVSKPVVADHTEDELEKPSFLRRLAKRNKNDHESTPDKDDENTDKK